ncbi:MAG: T9SS type A sorting domain-containing protein [Salibacteraceae bacterium]
MNSKTIKLITTFFSFFIFFQSIAGHVSGGRLEYKSLGSGKYLVTGTVYFECGGAVFTDSSLIVHVSCPSGGLVDTIVLNQSPYIQQSAPVLQGGYAPAILSGLPFEEISDLCSDILNPYTTQKSICRTNPANSVGYAQAVYSSVVTLPSCVDLELSFSPPCCRSLGNSNVNSSMSNYSIVANTAIFPKNSSVEVRHKPVQSLILGNSYSFYPFVLDSDDDSLVIVNTCPKFSSSQCATFATGFSVDTPINNFSKDTIQGVFHFTPTSTGKRILALEVREYDRCSKLLKSKSQLEFQFVVVSSMNSPPIRSTSIVNVSSGVRRLDSVNLVGCYSDTLRIMDTIIESDLNDTLVFYTDFIEKFPNGTFASNLIRTSQGLIGVVSFEVPLKEYSGLRKAFHLEFNDNNCSAIGRGTAKYILTVEPSANITQFNNDCENIEYIYLRSGQGGVNHKWSVLQGDSLIWAGANRNIWGDTTLNDTNSKIRLKLNSRSLIKVEINGFCSGFYCGKRVDSLWIQPKKGPFNLVTTNDTIICSKDSIIELFARTDSSITLDYSWSPTNMVVFQNNGKVGIKFKHSASVKVSATDTLSKCNKVSTIRLVKGDEIYPQEVTSVCRPIMPNNNNPLSLISKLKANKNLIEGNDLIDTVVATSIDLTQSNYNFSDKRPFLFSENDNSARHVIEYKQAELSNLGLVKNGVISSIEFFVINQHGIDTVKNMTVKIVQFDSGRYFNRYIDTMSSTLMDFKSFSIKNGWNKFPLEKSFVYDGKSNVAIVFCYYLANRNPRVLEIALDRSNFGGATQLAVGSVGVCDYNRPLYAILWRPALRLGIGSVPIDEPSQISWLPSSLFVNNQGDSVLFHPSMDTTYRVKYSLSKSGCLDSVNVNYKVEDFWLKLDNDTTVCPKEHLTLSQTNSHGYTPYWATDTIFSAYRNYLNVYVRQSFRVMAKVDNGCGYNIVDTMEITARPLSYPLLAPYAYDSICKTSTYFTLIPPDSGGIFSGSLINNNQLQLIGVPYDITDMKYSVVEQNCVYDTSYLVFLIAPDDTTFISKRRYCKNEGPVQLMNMSKSKGVWKGQGIIDSSGIFDARVVNFGKAIISFNSKAFCPNDAQYELTIDSVHERQVDSIYYLCPNVSAIYFRLKSDSLTGIEWNSGSTSEYAFINSPGKYWVKTNKYNCERIDTFKVERASSCLGVKEGAVSDKFNIYPNPARDFVVIKQEDLRKENLDVFVFDLSGSLVLRHDKYRVGKPLSVENLAPGSYVMHVKRQGAQSTFKLIVSP